MFHLFQNNIVLNKKQLQSTLEIIKDNNESMIIGDNNSGILFIKEYKEEINNNKNQTIREISDSFKRLKPKDCPMKLDISQIGT